MRPVRIAVVGSSNLDLIARVPRFPAVGETLSGDAFHMGFGGKGANQAVMAARLGAAVAMVSKLGRDVFGDMTLANYRAQGVGTEHVRFDEARASGVAPIWVDAQGRNQIVVVPGANLGLSPEDVRAARPVIEGADVLVCQLEVPLETTLEALRLGRAAGVRTLLNPAPAVPLPDELLAQGDLLCPNETEAELLTGAPVPTLAEAEVAARRLQARGARTVVLTLGARGALVLGGGTAAHVPAPEVRAVDTTGAGDAFIGSLATFLGEGQPLLRAARWACAVASRSVTRVGTQSSFPTRDEISALLTE